MRERGGWRQDPIGTLDLQFMSITEQFGLQDLIYKHMILFTQLYTLGVLTEKKLRNL